MDETYLVQHYLDNVSTTDAAQTIYWRASSLVEPCSLFFQKTYLHGYILGIYIYVAYRHATKTPPGSDMQK